MKLLGFILIVLSSTVCGICYSSAKNDRIRELESFCTLLERLKAELTFRQSPIPELAEKLSAKLDGKAAMFMKLLTLNLTALGEKSFSLIWGESFEACSVMLGDGEYKAFLELGNVLGRYDLASQIDFVSNLLKSFQNSLALERSELPQLKRVSLGLSMSAGAMLAIILV